MAVLTPEQLQEVIVNEKLQKIRDRKFPFHVMRYDLLKKYGRENIIESLRYLVRNQIIEMGNSCNDYWFNIELEDCPEKEFEIEVLVKGRFI